MMTHNYVYTDKYWCALDGFSKSINLGMNAMRRAGRGIKGAKRTRLAAEKQRSILQQLEPVRGIEKIVIKPTGQMVTTWLPLLADWLASLLCSILPLSQFQASQTLTWVQV